MKMDYRRDLQVTMESFDSHCKAFSFFGFDLLSANSYWHILFYAILFY